MYVFMYSFMSMSHAVLSACIGVCVSFLCDYTKRRLVNWTFVYARMHAYDENLAIFAIFPCSVFVISCVRRSACVKG